jgi:hypothetical protein
VDRGRGRGRATRILAEQTRSRPAVRSGGGGRGRGWAARVLAEQSRCAEGDTQGSEVREDLLPSPREPTGLAFGEPEDRLREWRGPAFAKATAGKGACPAEARRAKAGGGRRLL